MKKNISSILLLSITILFISCGGDSSKKQTKSSDKKEELPLKKYVFFENLKDGDTVPTEFVVKMGVEGMIVKPAGKIVKDEGHHHIIVDGSPIPKDEVVPADETHIHYGKGQTEATLNLTEGEHTLTMQFANGVHISYGKQMSETINIIVKNQ